MTGITDPDERRIAEAVITEALGRGFTLDVHDGYEYIARNCADLETALNALGHTGQDSIQFRKAGRTHGWVLLVWGNGSCTVSDYTENEWTRAILALAHKIQDEMDERDEA